KALAREVHRVTVGGYRRRAVMPFGIDIRYWGRLTESTVGIVSGHIHIKVRLFIGTIGLPCRVPCTCEIEIVIIGQYRAEGAVLLIVDIQFLLIKHFGLVP